MSNKIKILITGGTGFIGNALIKKLNNYNIQILSISRNLKKNSKNIQWVKSDLKLNKKATQKIHKFQPEIIFHLAWEKIPDFSEKICKINYIKTIAFFRKVLKIKSLKKIVVSGSCFEYLLKKGKKRENNAIDTDNNFPKTKSLIFKFLKKNCNKNLKIAWFRIFYAYGPGQRKNSLIPYLIRSLTNKNKVILKSPYVRNDFIFVDDIAKVLIKTIYSDFNTGIYNLGTGTQTKTTKIIKLIEKISGKKFNLDFSNIIDKERKTFYADTTKIRNQFKVKKFVKIKNGLNKVLFKV